jgi:hypothetical protein
VRCRHQRFRTGCAIHEKTGYPIECRLWSCRYLVDETLDLPRPDHGHYCIDIVPDYVTAQQPGRGEVSVPVIQIWNDPHCPDAHRDPRLRAWLEVMSREGWCALVRFSPSEAMMLIPPLLSDTKKWEEVGDTRMTLGETTHKAEDIAAKLANAGIYPTMTVEERWK